MEFLDVKETGATLDFSKIVENNAKKQLKMNDNPDVPPLEYI